MNSETLTKFSILNTDILNPVLSDILNPLLFWSELSFPFASVL